MTIQQISVFLENKYGRLNEILGLIAREDIRIVAATVADTSEFGILRIISTDPQKTLQVLKNNRISANLSEVFAIATESKPGQFACSIEHFTKAGVSIEYMYCFSTKMRGVLILRTNNVELSKQVILERKLVHITQPELQEL